MTSHFITFEGGEGAGKSTQIERLRRRLQDEGYDVLVTREPGGSPKAEEIRAFILEGKAKAYGPLAETVLFAAARIDHLDNTIKPALASGKTVLCDRFADSTRAYQGALGHVERGLIDAIERVTLSGTRPDLTLILDLSPEIGLARAQARRQASGGAVDRFEAEGVAFHIALRNAFLTIAQHEKDRCIVVDASHDPEEVEKAIWAIVKQRLADLASRPDTKEMRHAS